jgi:hypothetical protein
LGLARILIRYIQVKYIPPYAAGSRPRHNVIDGSRDARDVSSVTGNDRPDHGTLSGCLTVDHGICSGEFGKAQVNVLTNLGLNPPEI